MDLSQKRQTIRGTGASHPRNNPMVPALAPIVTLVALWATCLASCNSRSSFYQQSEPVEEEIPEEGILVPAQSGAVLKSDDQRFSFTVDPGTFSVDVRIYIERQDDAPSIAIGPAYRVRLTPTSADPSHDNGFRAGFHVLEDEGLPNHEELTLGFRHYGSGPLIQYPLVPDSLHGALVARAPGVGAFSLLHDTRCPTTSYACDSGECLEFVQVCDGIQDCSDGSDESSCEGNEDIYEPDNTLATAASIPLGEPQQRTLHTVSDIDVARFELDIWSRVTVTTSGIAGDTFLTIYDEDGAIVDVNDDGEGTSFSKVVLPQLGPGIYFAEVYEVGRNATIAGYELLVSPEPIEPPLVPPTNLRVVEEDGGLWVRWDAAAGADAYRVYFGLDGEPPFDDGLFAVQGASPITMETGTEIFLTGLEPLQSYFVALSTISSGEESLLTAPVEQYLSLSPDFYEPDETLGAAQQLVANSIQVHSLDRTDDVDVVFWEVDAISDMRLQVLSPSHGVEVRFLDAAGAVLEVISPEAWRSGVGRRTQVLRAALAPGLYHAEIRAADVDAVLPRYTIRLDVAPPLSAGVPVLSATPGDGEVLLSWTTVDGAAFYDVYYDEDGGPEYVPTTVATEGAPPLRTVSTELRLGGLGNGQRYYFAVVASNGVYSSDFSDEVAAIPAAAPDAFEPDDTLAEAATLVLDTPQSRSMHVGADVDHGAMTITTAGDYRISTDGEGTTRLKLELLSQDGNVLATALGNSAEPFPALQANLEMGSYYVRVRSLSLVSVPSYVLVLTQP